MCCNTHYPPKKIRPSRSKPTTSTDKHKVFGVEIGTNGFVCQTCYLVTLALSKDNEDVLAPSRKLWLNDARHRNMKHALPESTSKMPPKAIVVATNSIRPSWDAATIEVQSITNFIEAIACCLRCTRRTCKCTTVKHVGVTVVINFKCTSCNKMYKYDGSTFRAGTKQFEINYKESLSFQASGMTYPQYEKQHIISGVPPLSKKIVFNAGKNIVGPAFTELSKESNQAARMETFFAYMGDFRMKLMIANPAVSQLPFEILKYIHGFLFDCVYYICAFDGRYSSMGFNAQESTFTVVECALVHKIIDVIHIEKYRPRGKDKDNVELEENQIIGASSAMEGKALKIWLSRHLEGHYTIEGMHLRPMYYVHDRDGKASQIIVDFFVNNTNQLFIPQELSDGAHGKKNFVAAVLALFGDYLGKSAGRFWSLVKCNTRETLKNEGIAAATRQWREMFSNWPNHKNGDHSKCTETCPKTKRRFLFEKKKGNVKVKFEKLVKVCTTIGGRGIQYIRGYATGLNESLHRMYKCSADKTLDYRLSYKSRIDSEALRYNAGNDQYMILFAERAKFKLCAGALAKLAASARARESKHDNSMSSEGKLDKIHQHLTTRALHNNKKGPMSCSAIKLDDEQENYYSKSHVEKKKRSIDDVSDVVGDKKVKKAKIYPGYCTCTKGSCDNCICRKHGVKCNDKCHKKQSNSCCINIA